MSTTKTHSDPTVSTPQKVADTVTALGKLALLSRRCDISPCDDPEKPLIIMANGPSLRQTIDTCRDTLLSCPTLAVNFAANTPDFFSLKPRYYVLADPLFFAAEPRENIALLRSNLEKVDFPMTLFVPRGCNPHISNSHILTEHFNNVGIDGADALCRWAYSRKLAMPRPRNVLIPSIMIGIWMGYRQIYITGADHSWMQTISVDDDNHVVSIQPHFYKEDEKEHQKVKSDYEGFTLHQIVHSFYVAFRAYHRIAEFAGTKNVSIFNSTPGSFIDAFERRPLPDTK